MKFVVIFFILLFITPFTYADDTSKQSNWVFTNIYPPRDTIDEYLDFDTIKNYFKNRPIQLNDNKLLVGDYCSIQLASDQLQKLNSFQKSPHNFALSVFESLNGGTPPFLNYLGYSAKYEIHEDCDFLTEYNFIEMYFDDEHLVLFLSLSTDPEGGPYNFIPIVYKKSVTFDPKPLPEDDVLITSWFPLVCASNLLHLDHSECRALELKYSVVKTINYAYSDGYLVVTHIHKKNDNFNNDNIIITEEIFDRGPRTIFRFEVSDNIVGDYWYEEEKIVAKFTHPESNARIKFASDIGRIFINNMFFHMKTYPHEHFDVKIFIQNDAICYNGLVHYEDIQTTSNNIADAYPTFCINNLGQEVIFDEMDYFESDEYQG